MTTPPAPTSAPGTKERILDAAESLFARQGFAATSLRSITSEAGVNLASIHYHYGSKEALVRAVFARRIEPVNRERIAGLDVLESTTPEDAPLDLDRLIEVFLGPGLRLAAVKEGRVILAMLARMHAEPSEVFKKIFFEQFQGIKDRFIPAFERALPDLPHEELIWRLHFLVGTMAQTMGEGDRLRVMSDGRCDPTDVDGTLRRLVPFVAAGMRAPLPDPAGGAT